MSLSENQKKLEDAILSMEELKRSGLMSPEQADLGLVAMRKLLATYQTTLDGDGAVAQGDGAVAVGERGVYVKGDIIGTKIDIIIQNAMLRSLPFPQALAQYLSNIITSHHSLRLQGIRAGNQLLSVSLEKVYVSLSVIDKNVSGQASEREYLREPETGNSSIASVLQKFTRLVIVGDPGCGKTTLISYLGLTYARTLAGEKDWVKERLGLQEPNHLPIILPLRDFGHHLMENHPRSGKDGPALLLDYLRDYYRAQHIFLPEEFFSSHLENGSAILLLDGMDEVAEASLRQRVARLIEGFANRYEKCRYIVTSREVGYDGATRIGAGFKLAKVAEFTPQEVRSFILDWTRVVETTLAGSESFDILAQADEQANNLIKAIEGTPRVADLAVNPLLLTVVALVHRYRAQLPERRSELYEEAVEVLLAHWDEAKGLGTSTVIGGRELDAGDRRSLLEPVAFWMHERKKREIEREELNGVLLPTFEAITEDVLSARKALDGFVNLINMRSGLLVERGVGVYSFAHLTFQEYLTARALADRKDAVDFTLKHLHDPWWREVVLLEAGYLSTQGKRRVSELIRAIMGAKHEKEPEPFYNLLLAAECLFDVGAARVEGDLLGETRKRLQKQANAPLKKGDKQSVITKISATNALARIDNGQVIARFWNPPYGEPEWVIIPAGEFWMGDDDGSVREKPLHKLYLPQFQIARVPVTNAQYAYFVKDTGAEAPEHWRGGDIPPGLENHPVVYVTWYDALSYCKWLSKKIQKNVVLPSEAEWEKAARGNFDTRFYPWGNEWKDLHCNTDELGLNDTIPVGLFLNGSSPYKVLDMSGNVWEWTRSLLGREWDNPFYNYPYDPKDSKREQLEAEREIRRVLRGGSYNYGSMLANCTYRNGLFPDLRSWYFGFRVALVA